MSRAWEYRHTGHLCSRHSERERSKHKVRNNTCCRPIYSDTDSGMYANMVRSPGLLRLSPFVQGKQGKLAIHIPRSALSSVFEGDPWPRYPRYPPKWMSLVQHGTSRASGMVSQNRGGKMSMQSNLYRIKLASIIHLGKFFCIFGSPKFQ